MTIITVMQDGPSWLQRTVTSFVTPHLVRLPHLPLETALRCHLQNVTSTTDRHKLRRWSLLHFFALKCATHLSVSLHILLLLSSLPSMNMYEGPFQARRSVEGLRSITLRLLRIWVLGLLSHHHDELAARTVVAMTVCHELHNPTLGQTSPSSFSSFTTMPPTDHNRLDGPSQSP